MSSRFAQVADFQVEHHIIRVCLDGCKVNHLLRATDISQHMPVVSQANDVILASFEDLVGIGLSPTQRTQAGLPLTAGGCGLKLPLM